MPAYTPKKGCKVLFRVVKIVSFGLFLLGIGLLLPDNQEDFAFFNISEAFGQNRQMFLSPVEKNIAGPPGFILINQNSLQATFPLTVFSSDSRTLGVLIEEAEHPEENRETRNNITEYVVKEGDTLWSIADKFDISVETIAWENNLNLRRANIKPGQKLVILPVSGIRHIVRERETISRIAEKYNIESEKILDFNNISDEGEISIDQALIIPGGRKQAVRTVAERGVRQEVERTAPKRGVRQEVERVAPERVIDKISDNIVNINDIDIEELTPNQVRAKFSTNNYWGQSHAFPFGQCTWWPAQRRPIGRWGHAKSWLSNAERDGFEVCRGRNCQPSVGAVLVIIGNPVFGHVALVEEIRGNKIIFSEMNGISGWGRINKRTVEIGSNRIVGFIY